MRFRRPSGGRLAVTAIVLGFLLSGAMMFAGSYAAFVSTTSNAGNNWAAGTVVLADDDSGAAMFTTGAVVGNQVSADGMRPGQSVVNCIRVTYTGNLPAVVKLYANPVSETNGSGGTGLLAYLHMKIEEGTAGAFGCSGFAGAVTVWDSSTHGGVASDLLSVFPTTYASGPGVGPALWATNTFRVYRFTVTLDSSVPDTSQGATATATFNWQAQNS